MEDNSAEIYNKMHETIVQEHIDGLLETREILQDEEAMEALRRAIQDIKEGRVTPWEEVKKELGLQ